MADIPISMVMLFVSFLCFLAAGFGVAIQNINFVAVGLAFWAAARLLNDWA